MKRIATLMSILLFFGAVHAQSANAGAAADAVARFYADMPHAQAEALAEANVDATAEVDLSKARYVVLDTAHGSYTFALSATARTAGAIELAVEQGQQRAAATLSEVHARLDAAAHGRTDLAVFTDAEPEDGVVVGLYALSHAQAEIEAEGASHVRLIKDGDPVTVQVRTVGDTLADVTVEGDAGTVEGVLDVDVSGSVAARGDASVDAGADGDGGGAVEVGGQVGAEVGAETDARGNAEAEGDVDAEVDAEVDSDDDVNDEPSDDDEDIAEGSGDSEGELDVEIEGELD